MTTDSLLEPARVVGVRRWWSHSFTDPFAGRLHEENMKPSIIDLYPDRVVVVPSGCWIWIASMSGNGYGAVRWNGKQEGTHRVSYELAHGQISGGLVLDHLCRTTLCVNPDHLEEVTCRENLLRGETLAAENHNKTRCIRGHPLSGSNLNIDCRGMRQCRICNRMRSKRCKDKMRKDPSWVERQRETARAAEARRPKRTHVRSKR